MKRRGVLLLMSALLAAGASAADDVLLATTTSVRDSGLLDALLPVFEKQTGLHVKVVAVGSGAALRMAAQGNADVLVTHAPSAEEELVASGALLERVPFMESVRFHSPKPITGRGVDIGAGGIGVILDESLEVGTPVEIEVFAGHATAYGAVQWSREERGAHRVGIKFRSEDWAVMELISSMRGQEG